MLSLKQGSELVRFARKTIEQFFDAEEPDKLNGFNKKQGVFVTLFTYPKHELRGCIGFPYPSIPLGQAVKEAARSSAFSDLRFMPLRRDELKKVVVEISVLTMPEEIKCKREDIPANIKIGKDGLIVSYNGRSGLLLPQVAAELHWDSRQFIEQACAKAGLPQDTWRQEDCKIYLFQAQIFSETKPMEKAVDTS